MAKKKLVKDVKGRSVTLYSTLFYNIHDLYHAFFTGFSGD